MPQPTRILIQQEAGRAHDAFGRRIEGIANECAPLVEEVTGLGLPERVVIRLLTPRAWRRAATASFKQLVLAEMAELVPDRRRLKAVRRQAALMPFGLRVMWMLCGPRTITTPEGDAEIIMTPESARHAGRYDDDDHLYLAFGHELVHPAQHHVDRARLLVLSATPFAQERGIADRAVAALTEGHATWAGKRIGAKILGYEPGGSNNPPVSKVFRKRSEAFSRTGTMERNYVDGSAFAVGAIEGTGEVPGLGIERFNRIWHQPDLFPTTEEIGRPVDWLHRVLPELERET